MSDDINGAEKAQHLNDKQEVRDSAGRARVLIIEDNSGLQNMLCSALELTGYCVSAVVGERTAPEWIDKALQAGDSFAVILLDLITLSCTEAIAFLRNMRAQWAAFHLIPPPILVLTTSNDIHKELSATEHVLQKPFHIGDLIIELYGLTIS